MTKCGVNEVNRSEELNQSILSISSLYCLVGSMDVDTWEIANLTRRAILFSFVRRIVLQVGGAEISENESTCLTLFIYSRYCFVRRNGHFQRD